MLLPRRFSTQNKKNQEAILFIPCGLHVSHGDADDVCILAVVYILSYVHDDKDITLQLTSAVVVATSSLAYFRVSMLSRIIVLFYRLFKTDSISACRLRVAANTTSAYIPPNNGKQWKQAMLIIQLGMYHNSIWQYLEGHDLFQMQSRFIWLLFEKGWVNF